MKRRKKESKVEEEEKRGTRRKRKGKKKDQLIWMVKGSKAVTVAEARSWHHPLHHHPE